MKQRQPKTLRKFKDGLLPYQAIKSVLNRTALEGSLFFRNTAMFGASAYNFLGIFLSCSIHLVISMMYLFLLSLTPFFSGVYRVVS